MNTNGIIIYDKVYKLVQGACEECSLFEICGGTDEVAPCAFFEDHTNKIRCIFKYSPELTDTLKEKL